MFKKHTHRRVAGTRSNSPVLFEGLESRKLFAAVTASVANGVLTISGTDSHDRITVSRDAQQNIVIASSTYVPNRDDLLGLGKWVASSQTINAASVTKMVVSGGKGNDAIEMKTGIAPPASCDPQYANMSVFGGDGDDLLDTRMAGCCLMDGGKGADKFLGSLSTAVDYRSRMNNLYIDRRDAGNDGEAGENDSIDNGIGYVLLGSGNDTVIASGLHLIENIVRGFAGNDRLIGSTGVCDVLEGGAGDDVIVGGSGIFTLVGGEGNDLIDARAGAGYVYGGNWGSADPGFDMAWVDANDIVSGIDAFL